MEIRNPSIDIAALDISGNWLAQDGFRTQLFNALSMTFPLGEGYFIDCVRAALPLLQDPTQHEAIRLFIGQEAAHSRLHRAVNRRLEEHGLHYVIEPLIRWRIKRSEQFTIASRLAITMAYEHFTASFGDIVLNDPSWLDGVEPAMRDFWLWHAAEECEHRAVAFDAYTALGGGYGRRVAWFLYVSVVFTIDIWVQTLHNLARSGQLWHGRSWRQAAQFLIGRHGLLWRMLPMWRRYFRRDFHPDQIGPDQPARDWLTRKADLFGR